MPTARQMDLVLALYRADKYCTAPGLHLWTGKRHVQLWPLWRLGKSIDV